MPIQRKLNPNSNKKQTIRLPGGDIQVTFRDKKKRKSDSAPGGKDSKSRRSSGSIARHRSSSPVRKYPRTAVSRKSKGGAPRRPVTPARMPVKPANLEEQTRHLRPPGVQRRRSISQKVMDWAKRVGAAAVTRVRR